MKLTKKNIYKGEPGYCFRCGNNIFSGCSIKCPHKPITRGAYWFKEMYCGGGKEKFINNIIKNKFVPFPKWCKDNLKLLKKLELKRKYNQQKEDLRYRISEE